MLNWDKKEAPLKGLSGMGGGVGRGGSVPITATGGTVTTEGNYTVHTFTYPASGQNFVVETCIDNLIKGASGNAVECMNLMFSEVQSLGLKEMLPLYL